MNQNNEPEYEDINLREFVKFFLRKKGRIFSITALFVAMAIVYSLLTPKVFRIEESLEVGVLAGPEKSAVIESPTQIKEKLDGDVYGRLVRDKLKIDREEYPEIKTKHSKDTDVLFLSTELTRPDLAVKIFEEINNLILADHNQIVDSVKKDLDNGIAIEKRNAERLINKVKAVEEEKKILENKIAAVQRIPVENQDPGTQYALLDAKEQLEEKIMEIENLYLQINENERKIGSMESEKERNRPTAVIKKPAYPEQPVKPKLLLNIILSAIFGFLAAACLVFATEWWEKNK